MPARTTCPDPAPPAGSSQTQFHRSIDFSGGWRRACCRRMCASAPAYLSPRPRPGARLPGSALPRPTGRPRTGCFLLDEVADLPETGRPTDWGRAPPPADVAAARRRGAPRRPSRTAPDRQFTTAQPSTNGSVSGRGIPGTDRYQTVELAPVSDSPHPGAVNKRVDRWGPGQAGPPSTNGEWGAGRCPLVTGHRQQPAVVEVPEPTQRAADELPRRV